MLPELTTRGSAARTSSLDMRAAVCRKTAKVQGLSSKWASRDDMSSTIRKDLALPSRTKLNAARMALHYVLSAVAGLDLLELGQLRNKKRANTCSVPNTFNSDLKHHCGPDSRSCEWQSAGSVCHLLAKMMVS